MMGRATLHPELRVGTAAGMMMHYLRSCRQRAPRVATTRAQVRSTIARIGRLCGAEVMQVGLPGCMQPVCTCAAPLYSCVLCAVWKLSRERTQQTVPQGAGPTHPCLRTPRLMCRMKHILDGRPTRAPPSSSSLQTPSAASLVGPASMLPRAASDALSIWKAWTCM